MIGDVIDTFRNITPDFNQKFFWKSQKSRRYLQKIDISIYVFSRYATLLTHGKKSFYSKNHENERVSTTL